jgi:hypothetical protein
MQFQTNRKLHLVHFTAWYLLISSAEIIFAIFKSTEISLPLCAGSPLLRRRFEVTQNDMKSDDEICNLAL